MSDNEYAHENDSPKKAYKEVSFMIRNLSQGKKKKDNNLSGFYDQEKKQHYMPRRYDVHEMIQESKSIHESLGKNEQAILNIDNKMVELDSEHLRKLNNEIKITSNHEKTTILPFRTRPLKRKDNDFQLFKEIFVQPREENLSQLRKNAADIKDKVIPFIRLSRATKDENLLFFKSYDF